MTVITQPDTRPLLSLPTWNPGSLRVAGNQNSLWYALWDAIATSYLPALNAVIDFSNNDVTLWTGPDEAEGDFLSFWTPELAVLRQTQDGTETDEERLERLLTLRTLLAVPAPETTRVMGWALTAALGLASRASFASGSVPDGAFIPSLVSVRTLNILLDASDPGTLTRRTDLGDVNYLIAGKPLWRRAPVYGAPPCRFSPWGRAGSSAVLDRDMTPLTDGVMSEAVEDTRLRPTLSLSFPVRPYDTAIRPGIIDPQQTVEALTSANPVKVVTTADALKRGDADFRVPGGILPTPRWRQAVLPAFTPSWAVGPRRDVNAMAPPFDLDTDISQPTPASAPAYGTGTVPAGLPVGHPLALDYA
jgi:hypothetical protein